MWSTARSSEGAEPVSEADPVVFVPAPHDAPSAGWDDEPPARSNCASRSNVYIRDVLVPAHSDSPFRQQVRGKQAILDIYQRAGILFSGPAGLHARDGRTLEQVCSPLQVREIKQYACALCGRIDFGPILQADGRVKWGFLAKFGRACLCRRAAITGPE
jgi:hypothetical protein